MPSKRKHQPPNKDGFIVESPYSKRPRRSVVNQSDIAQTIYDLLREYEDENNHNPSDSFMKLPSKRHNPDYYEKIVDPVDLTKIAQRIKTDEYRDIEILTTDIQLMTSNAKKYYEEEAQEYTDACALWELYLNTKAKVFDENKDSEKSLDSGKTKSGRKLKNRSRIDDDQESDCEDAEITIDDLKDLFENLVTETDDADRVIAEMFMLLPDRKANDQYYEIIKEPIDFVTIGDKLEEGKYKTIADLKKDVNLLVKNARTFNDPHSQIYRDALTLKNIFREKSEILERSKKPGFVGVKLSARVKNRNTNVRGSERLHEKSIRQDRAVELSKQDLHDASIFDTGEDDFQSQLYNEVVNYTNQLGHTICDPFVRLPNKRFYPMYYDDIENPISLKIIRKKITTKKYENCEDMAEDFQLLFSNAKQFNIGTSQIHKDASTLQKFFEAKLPEFVAKEEEMMEDESGSDDEQSRSDDKIEEDAEDNNEATDDKEATPKKQRRRRKSVRDILKNRLLLLYNSLMQAKDESGREMIALFLEKPSRKDYPDYYKLVLEPIDMKMIGKKIEHDKYCSVPDMLEDFNLMFNNARHYNEPGSEVYSDADALEKLLLDKNKDLDPLPEELLNKTPRSIKRPHMSDLEEKLEKLFSLVRDYVDPTDRMICEIFMHLPTKQVLPDYYKVIKKPIDMDRIQMRMQTGQYLKLDEMLADLLLMLENACLYNEPGSLIYKDALLLQKVVADHYYQLEKVPEILSPENLVHEMLVSLFMSVMNHQDESGRCFSESFATHSTTNDSADKETLSSTPTHGTESPLSLDIIKKNLHNRRYRRLDIFQEHMFKVFQEARNQNRTDSEIYEDAIELQKFFIKIRDELCKNGETLLSPALSLTVKRLENEFEAEKKEKIPEEGNEDEGVNEEGKEMREKMAKSSQSDGFEFKGVTYKPGDYAYIDNPDNPGSPHIAHIVKLYTDETGQHMLYGVWMYRPEATFHMASKKFFVKEVFKSDYYNAVPLSLVQGKCFVMLSRDYFKLKPVGFKEEDVYVAESKYASKSKSFKRIKMNKWAYNSTELVPRDNPLPVIRISSCYSDQKSEDKASIVKMQSFVMHDIEDSWPTDVIQPERKNVEAEGIVSGETKHYVQYFANNTWFKVGDCVYLRQPNNPLPKVARIERLWRDGNGRAWFEGPWFVRPEETIHELTRMFYKKELFISCSEASFSLDDVIGKCVVLFAKDYFACRPTEVEEKDIYVFESKYIDMEKMIKKIKSCKRYAPSFKMSSKLHWYTCEDQLFFQDYLSRTKKQAVDDEYYYYKRPLVTEMIISPSLLALVEKETQARKQEAVLMKTKQEKHEESVFSGASATTSMPPMMNSPAAVYPVSAQPVAQVYAHAPMLQPGQPYPHYPQQVAPPYAVAPGHVDPHRPLPQLHPYPQQVYPPGPRYPPQIPVAPSPHVQHVAAFQAAPQVYSSPHGTIPPPVMTPSPAIQTSDSSRPPSARPDAVPTPPTKRKGRSGHSTGYILFASHCHPRVRSEHPEMPFGDISKIVGEEWRNLNEEKKREYEEKAKEQTAKAEAEGRLVVKKKKRKKDVEESTPATPTQTPARTATPQQYAHAPGQYPPTPEQGWAQRMPMGQPRSGGIPPQYQGSAPSYVQTPVGPAYVPQQVQPQPPPTVAQQHRRKRGPLYVKPPPKAQRIMHSEAYLRYIEGLEKESKSISNWDKTLNATEKDIKVVREQELPVHWIANGKGKHESTTAALWSLRNLMLRDALTIKSSLN